MISFQEARQIAENEINRDRLTGNDSLIIFDEAIIEKAYAWIFPYTSKRFLETNDINYALGGNGPIFISKIDGQVTIYSTYLSVEDMIDKFEEEHRIWVLSLAESEIDIKHLLILKKTLNWTQEKLATFKKNSDKTIDFGSKRRLIQLKLELATNNIGTSLILSNIV